MGLGFYMLHGVIQIYASELAPAARGSAMAMHSASFFFGNALGPVVYGWTLPSVGLTATVLPAGAILIGVGIVCARWLCAIARCAGSPTASTVAGVKIVDSVRIALS